MDWNGDRALPAVGGVLPPGSDVSGLVVVEYVSSKAMRPSLSSACFLRPQILQPTMPRAPSRMAPPTPTTTPMIVLRVLADMPSSPFELSSLRPGVNVVSLVVVLVSRDPSSLVFVTTVTSVDTEIEAVVRVVSSPEELPLVVLDATEDVVRDVSWAGVVCPAGSDVVEIVLLVDVSSGRVASDVVEVVVDVVSGSTAIEVVDDVSSAVGDGSVSVVEVVEVSSGTVEVSLVEVSLPSTGSKISPMPPMPPWSCLPMRLRPTYRARGQADWAMTAAIKATDRNWRSLKAYMLTEILDADYLLGEVSRRFLQTIVSRRTAGLEAQGARQRRCRLVF